MASPSGPSDQPSARVDPDDGDAVIELFAAVCDRAAEILADNRDWSMSGERDSQYAIDLRIDTACLDMLHQAGFVVLSEESGITSPDVTGPRVPAVAVVVDPLDGSTNASLELPWCATALCLVIDEIPTVAMVTNLATGQRWSAIRGRGALRDGRPVSVGAVPALQDAIIAVNARPPSAFRPSQFRCMGATALDIVSVAGAGGFDGSIDFDDDKIGVWDYLAAVMILREAGGVAADALGRDLVTLDHQARRRPVSAGSAALLDELLAMVSPGVGE